MGGVVAGAKASAAKISRRVPGEPRMARSVNTTAPSGLLVADVAPSSDPPPEAIWTVTMTPSRAMGVPSASWSCSAGWGDSGTPDTAIAGSTDVRTRRAARPVLMNLAASETPATEARVKYVLG